MAGIGEPSLVAGSTKGPGGCTWLGRYAEEGKHLHQGYSALELCGPLIPCRRRKLWDSVMSMKIERLNKSSRKGKCREQSFQFWPFGGYKV
jgi:hypothetical protein